MAPEVPPSRPTRKVWRVGELARRIRGLLESEIGSVWIEGECSNVKAAASGHIYFTLKDEIGQIQAAMFRAAATASAVRPADGLKVRLYGQISAYEKSGQVQVIVRQIEEAGAGNLHAAFERLKARLQAEGLFDASRKRPLPLLPRCIGIVTSLQAAALRDMLTVLERRYPNRHLLIAPCRVQGQGAALEIAAAIELLNEDGRAEVLIVGRGGGSLEDLWAFNEEPVARAIAASRVPVISAVGHETDFTIADFVADVRAPTPSAAAELVVRPRADLRAGLAQLWRRIHRAMLNAVAEQRAAWRRLAASPLLRDPSAQARPRRDRLVHLRTRLGSALLHAGNHTRRRLESARMKLEYGVRASLAGQRRRLDERMEDAQLSLKEQIVARRARLSRSMAQLRALDPTAILQRGFSLTQLADGRILRSSLDARPGDRLRTRLASGEILSDVVQTRKEPEHEPQERDDPQGI